MFAKQFISIKSLRWFWICIRFSIFQGSEYSSGVNVSGFWISRVIQCWSIFVNMSGFWIFKIFSLPRVLNFHCYTGFTYFCKYEYVLGCYYERVLNIPGFWICQVSAYASVTQASEYTRIWLNNSWIKCSNYDRIMNMPGQSFTGFWICLWF